MTTVPFRVRFIPTGQTGKVTNISCAYNGITNTQIYTWFDIDWDDGTQSTGVDEYMVERIGETLDSTEYITEIPILRGVNTDNGPSRQ